MKDLKEIKKDLEKCQAEYTELNTQLKKIEMDLYNYYTDLNSNKNQDNLIKLDSLISNNEDLAKELSIKIEIKKMELAILRKNYMIVLANKCLPDIASIVIKYKGKSIGPKTRDTIKSEIDKIICNFDDSYHAHFTDYSIELYEEGYTCKCIKIVSNVYDWLDNNKLKSFKIEDFYVKDKFIEDPKNYIKKQMKLFNKIKSMQQDLNTKIEDFNDTNYSNLSIFNRISTFNEYLLLTLK